jgi:hypothetical protein
MGKKKVGTNQCCESGSVGSICFWASWIRIRILQSEVWIRIRILLLSSKNDNDINVPSNKQKTLYKNLFFVGVLKVSDENSRIRIHYSEAWIRGSGCGSTLKCHGSATLVPYQSVTKKKQLRQRRMLAFRLLFQERFKFKKRLFRNRKVAPKCTNSNSGAADIWQYFNQGSPEDFDYKAKNIALKVQIPVVQH